MHLNSDVDLAKVTSLNNSGICTTYSELYNVHVSIPVPWLLWQFRTDFLHYKQIFQEAIKKMY